MSTKIHKAAPAWHAKVIAEIEREFAETNELTETARRRRARLGLMLVWIKAAGKADGSIPHGEFGPWLQKHLPAIPGRTAGDYITEARSVLDLLGWQICEIRKFDLPPHQLLAAKPEDLEGEARAQQKELLKVVDQKSNFRAVTQYKQVELVDDATVPKRGRAKGEGGRPPAPTGSIEEIIAANAKAALKHIGKVDQHLGKLGINFLAQPDAVLTAFLGALERTAKCVRAHLDTPPSQRDAKVIQKLWRSL